MSCDPNTTRNPKIIQLTLWIIGALVVFGMYPFLCLAEADNAPPAGQPDLLSPVAIATLGLSDDQIRRLEELKARYLRELAPLQNEYFSRKAEFQMLWRQSKPNRQDCMARHRELSMLHERISDCTLRYELDCRHVLSQEQEVLWRQMQSGTR